MRENKVKEKKDHGAGNAKVLLLFYCSFCTSAIFIARTFVERP